MRLGELTDRRRLSLQQHPALALRDSARAGGPARTSCRATPSSPATACCSPHYLITEQGPRFRQLQERLLAGTPWPAAWEQLFGPPRPSAWRPRCTAYRPAPVAAVRRLPVAFPPLAPPRAWRRFPFADVRAVAGAAVPAHRRPDAAPPSASAVPASSSPAASAWTPLSARALEFGWTLLDPDEARVRARATWQARPLGMAGRRPGRQPGRGPAKRWTSWSAPLALAPGAPLPGGRPGPGVPGGPAVPGRPPPGEAGRRPRFRRPLPAGGVRAVSDRGQRLRAGPRGDRQGAGGGLGAGAPLPVRPRLARSGPAEYRSESTGRWGRPR